MQILEELHNYLESLGYSKSTKSMILKGIKSFLQYRNSPNLTTTAEEIKAYHNYLQVRPNKRTGGGLSESYINHQVYALKVFFQWLVELERIEFNPMSELSFKTPSTKPRKIITIEEIQQLYAVTTCHLERAILGLYYGCGLRRSEGIDLQVNDIHFNKSMLYVKSGKYNKRRAVPLNPKVKADLKNYLLHERNNPLEHQYLLNSSNNPMLTGYVGKMFKNLVSKTGLDSDLSLHNLRHSIATHLLNSGMSLEYVQTFLGHSSIETTQIYTNIEQEKLFEI